MTISAIIPVLNEAARLPAVLRRLHSLPGVCQIIVVDGGSTDGSAQVALQHGAELVHSARANRGWQMNTGAQRATEPLLWFIHADTLPGVQADQHILAACRDPALVGGSFRRRFTIDRRALLILRLTVLWGDLRARILGVSFGDQTQFVRRSVFRQLGGFAVCERAEDMEFALRLRNRGRVLCIGPPVRSSARRFAGSPWRTVLSDTWLTWHFWRSPPGSDVMESP